MLNTQSPLPLYHQLAEILTQGIRTGLYPPGSKIPPETGLARTYGIGRPTARQAIEVLVRKGMVERRRGSGTYVKEPGEEIDLFSLAGTSSAFQRQGVPMRTRILEAIQLKEILNDGDNPFGGSQAFFYSRLTLAKSEPVLIEDIYLHPELFAGIESMDLSGKSLSQLISETFYMKPVNGRQNFSIATLSGIRARTLGIGRERHVLNVKRYLNFPQADNAIYSEFFCRTDRFVFSQTIGGITHD